MLTISTKTVAQYDIQPAQTSVNPYLINRALNSLQDRYNRNLEMVQNTETSCYQYISNQYNENKIDYDTYITIRNRFTDEYVNPTRRKGYDYSNRSLTLNVVDYLIKGMTNIFIEEFKKK